MYGRWRTDGKAFDLGPMNLRQLASAYASHPAAHLYLVSVVVAGWINVRHAASVWPPTRGASGMMPVCPLAWSLIRRFMLRSDLLDRCRLSAALWKRIRDDQHQDPYRMGVLTRPAERVCTGC